MALGWPVLVADGNEYGPIHFGGGISAVKWLGGIASFGRWGDHLLVSSNLCYDPRGFPLEATELPVNIL